MNALPTVRELPPELAGAPTALAGRLENASAQDVLRWAHERWQDRLAIVTSFQAEGVVILDLAHSLGLPLRVVTIDTGRLPQETYDLWERLRARYGLSVEVVMPDPNDVAELVARRGPNLFFVSPEDREACCRVRKVLPFRKATEGLSAWISGLRRGQTAARASVGKVEPDLGNRPDGSLWKISPLADWTEEQVWEHIRSADVPYHGLYDRGYRSIGCAPCSRASRPGEAPRASRWWWEVGGKRECGLHLGRGC